MGLAGDAEPTRAAPGGNAGGVVVSSSDFCRPPRLSSRERSCYCFHFDLSADAQYTFSSLVNYVISYGARYSAFFDINVTHIITDKPRYLIESSALAQKFGTKIICLSDFLHRIVESYNRPQSAATAVPPLSPTLRKAAAELNLSRNLSHLLAEEKRTAMGGLAARVGRVITPLYNAATGGITAKLTATFTKVKAVESVLVPSPPLVDAKTDSKCLGIANGRKIFFEPFRHPFVLLEEPSHCYAPIYKEYVPRESHLPIYPVLNLHSPEFHCPWTTADKYQSTTQAARPPLAPPLVTSVNPVLVPSNPNRALKTVRTLMQHQVNPQKLTANHRPMVKGLGYAPLPPINAHSSAVKTRPERQRPGFCECCYEKYSEMEVHLQKESHRRLVCNGDFYRAVDRVVSSLERPFSRTAHHPASLQGGENTQHSLPDDAPLSPAKSVVTSTVYGRAKSFPLRNITNQMAHAPSAALPNKVNYQNAAATVVAIPMGAAATAAPAADMNIIEIGSDSPLYSSPSFKRRRSQRLVARSSRSLTTTKFVL